MRARGVEPDAGTQRIAGESAQELTSMRKVELTRRVQCQDDAYAQHAVWELFSALCERGVVEPCHVAAMRPAARRMEQGEGIVVADERRYLANYWSAEQRLLSGDG